MYSKSTTAETLRELIREFGLREIAHGRPTKLISPSYAKLIAQNELNGGVLGKLVGRLVKLIPDRLSLPYVLDDIFWALFQKPKEKVMK